MNDATLRRFLEDQRERGMALAANSDVLDLMAIQESEDMPPQGYIAMYNCKSALRNGDGQIHIADSQFHVGISFGRDHLRYVDPLRLVTWLAPGNIFHPNIRPPGFCVGRVRKGIPLVDILYQVFEIITYVNWSTSDLLNEAAAQWVRHNQNLLPVDRKTLMRKKPPSNKQEHDKPDGGPKQ